MSGKIKLNDISKKTINYCQELVMLNHLFELKLLSKDEMLAIKRDIMKSYDFNDIELLK